jgi:polyphosphate kinase
VAPLTFLSQTVELLRRERRNAKQGLPSGVVAKINALFDPYLIEELYQASCDGVPVRLVVRGICALRPGIPGLSENIRIKSVVGRYLEHSRVFCFRNGGEEEVYIGSGDWMLRNLRERVEVVAPIKAPEQRARLLTLLSVYWHDDVDTRWMDSEGVYRRAVPPPGQSGLSAQQWFMAEAAGDPVPSPPPLWEDVPEAGRGPETRKEKEVKEPRPVRETKEA